MTLPSPEASRHPLLDESPLPYGLPDFAAIREEDLEPAIRTAIDDHAAEVAAIVANPESATVDNTVVALERSSRSAAPAAVAGLVHDRTATYGETAVHWLSLADD